MWARLILILSLCVFFETGASAASLEGITELGGAVRVSVFIEPNESVEGVCDFIVSKYPKISKEACLRGTIQKGRRLVLPKEVSPQTFPSLTDGSGFFKTPIIEKKVEPSVAASPQEPDVSAPSIPLTLQVALPEPVVEEEVEISVPEPPQEVATPKVETPVVVETIPTYDEALEETRVLNSKVLLEIVFWVVGPGLLLIAILYVMQRVVPWIRKKIRERATGGGMVPPPQSERKEPMFGKKKEEGVPAGPVHQRATTPSKPSEAGTQALIDNTMKAPGSQRPSMNPEVPINRGLPHLRTQGGEELPVPTSQDEHFGEIARYASEARRNQAALDLIRELIGCGHSTGKTIKVIVSDDEKRPQGLVIASGNEVVPMAQAIEQPLVEQVSRCATRIAEMAGMIANEAKQGIGKVVPLSNGAGSHQSSGEGAHQTH